MLRKAWDEHRSPLAERPFPQKTKQQDTPLVEPSTAVRRGILGKLPANVQTNRNAQLTPLLTRLDHRTGEAICTVWTHNVGFHPLGVGVGEVNHRTGQWIVVLDHERVRFGVSIVAQSGDLPGNFHIGHTSLDLEFVVLDLTSHDGLRELSDHRDCPAPFL